MCIICDYNDGASNILIGLEYLVIEDCPLVTQIPDTLIGLEYLVIEDCPLVTQIPDTLIGLEYLVIEDCYWLNYNNMAFNKNLQFGY
jgi:hypothetical protein